MSVQAITWAYSVADLDDPITRFALVTLANYADQQRVCTLSQARLLSYLRCSERKLRYCLRDLEAAGLIRAVERCRSDGSRAPNAYELTGWHERLKGMSP